MPTVPQRTSTVEDKGLPSITQSATASEETFGGPAAARVTRAAQGLAETVFKIADEEKRKADQLAILEADKELSALETMLQYDPQNGAMNKSGKDAFALPDTVKAEWEKGAAEIEKKSIKNESQRSAYRNMVVQRWKSVDGNVQRHVSGEIKKYDSETTEAYITNERDAATVNYMDPGRIEMSIARQQAALMDHAKRNGLPEEWVKLKMQDAVSKTQVGVIGRMLANGQDLDAKAYFDRNRDRFAGSDIVGVERALEEGTLRGESQRQTDAIVSKLPSMPDAINEAKKIKEPKLRDAVTDRIKDHFNTQRAAENERREKQYQVASNIVEQTKNRDEIPPDLWMALSLPERNALDARAAQLREGIPPVTDWNDYYNLKTMASSSATRSEFLQINMLTYRPKMADSEFKELVNLQTELRNGNDKTLDGYRTSAMIVNDTLAAAGIDPTPKPGKPAAKDVNEFRRLVDMQIEQQQKLTGRKVTNDDVQSIVDNLIVKGSVEGSGIFGMFKTKKRAFQVEEGETLAIDKSDIPVGERAKIIAALERAGRTVTDEAIVNLYNRKLQTMVPRAN